MIINEGLEEIRKADMIPGDVYRLKMSKPRSESPPEGSSPEAVASFVPKWCVVDCKIVSAKDPLNNDPKVIGREVAYWLMSSRTGLEDLAKFLEAKAVEEPGGKWADGIPKNVQGVRSTDNLDGVEFWCKITPFQYKRGTKKGQWSHNLDPVTL